MEVFVEPTHFRIPDQLVRGRTLGDQDTALISWFNGFVPTKAGNYVGSFFLSKKLSDIVIEVRINIFQSDRTTKPGCPWTWSIQITDGPRRMVMERPAYSNLYFKEAHEAAISVREDLRGGGYVPTQPERSSIIAAISQEQSIVERITAAEDRASVRRPAKRTRVIDT